MGFVFLILIVVMFALPTPVGLGLTRSHAVPSAPHGVAAPAAASISAGTHLATTPSPTRMPGTDPALLPQIDGPALARAALGTPTAHPVNWSLAAQQMPGGSSPGVSTTAAAAPHPAAGYSCPTGSVSGLVYNNTGVPLQGVTIQSYSASGATSCPLQSIPPVTTTVNGSFVVKAPVGADYLTFTLGFYLSNITYVQVYSGLTTYLASIVYMVQDAIASGTVEANNSKHTPLPGVFVSAVARDQSQICTPSAATLSDGKFRIGLCPLPSTISFSPPFGTLSTFRYANATPGQHVDLGVIYLETEPVIKVTLYDAVTRQAIPAAVSAITVCSAATNVCLIQGPTVGSSTVQGHGPRGYDYVLADSIGYLRNRVPIGWVNVSETIPPIYMVPLGGIGLSVSVTQNGTAPKWGNGWWVGTACSMNGFETSRAVPNLVTGGVNLTSSPCVGLGCLPPGPGFVAGPGFPLRNDIRIAPDWNGLCLGFPTWPLPGLLPAWGNETYLNVTPDEQTNAYLNLTPGNYIYGLAFVQPGNQPPAGGFRATGTSQDNPNLQSFSYTNTGVAASSDPWECPGYSWTPSTFCVPVPPGPGEIRISSLTQNYSDNYTWGSTPYTCCWKTIEPMVLAEYTGGISAVLAGFTSINLSRIGSVHGHVFQGDTHVGVFFGSVKVNAAGDRPLAPSFDGAVYLNGSFQTQSPLGWVSIKVSASGYAPNTVWAYVNGSTDVGNISLTPLATLEGQLIDPSGHGIYEADVRYCHVDTPDPNACVALGAGLSTTDGRFNGTLLGGWLPWTTYEVLVTAAGYTSDWSWVNTTAGATSVLPPIRLYPVGTNTTAASVHGQALGSSAAGVWIDGTLLDREHTRGIESGSIQACPVDGGACSLIQDGSNSQGYFNDSVPPGLYDLMVSAPGYFPVSQFFNASRASYVHLGALTMVSLPSVTGYADIAPWGPIWVRHGSGYVQIQLAPAATAFACNSNSTICGTALKISSQGMFFVQTGGGVYNKVQVSPSGGTVGPSINGGFGTNTTVFNATEAVTNLTHTLSLSVYAQVGGYVFDNSTASPTGSVPWIPSRWTPVSIATFGPQHASATWSTNGGGYYQFFLPPGPTNVLVVAGTPPEATVPKSIQINLTDPLNNTIPSGVTMMPELDLTHFGWIVFRLVNEVDGTGAAYVGITATATGPLNVTLASSGISNADGFVNLTAPPGNAVRVSIAVAEGFNASNFTVGVNASRTTFVNGSTLWDLGGLGLEPFGWVRSTGLNNSSIPNDPTVVDRTNGLPLPLANVGVASQMAGLTGVSLPTNWMGQFISDAPPGMHDVLTVTHWAYLPNTSRVDVAPNQVVVDPVINMSGLGILAGQVLKYPGLTPIPFATVQTCPYNVTGLSNCWPATTNDTGVFWVASYPGRVVVTVTASGYVSNTTTIGQSCSDCWTWLSPIILNEFSFVTGTVRALPSGLPIGDATVAACSPLGYPVGACGFEVKSAPNGQFLLAVPSGSYILQANATGFNTTFLPIYLVPGEILPVGILFLKQFGQGLGTVLSSATLLPVSNASVYACPTWSGGQCTPTAFTDAGGSFNLAGPPGPYTIAVLANGYADSYSSATLISGVRLTLAPILITPLGVNVFYQLGGRVVNASDPGSGISGAIVAATVGGSTAFSTRSGSDGGFLMSVLWGTYVLVVVDPGYRPAYQTVTVHNNVYGLLVQLPVMTFSVSGAVRDGLTNQPLSDVAIQEGIDVIAVSDLDGSYAFQAPNGTHALTATYEGGGSVAYAPVDFQAVVNGGPVLHDLSLVPPWVVIHGVVVDSLAGTPLAGAIVELRGITIDGVPIAQTVSADPSGGFTVTLYLGTYNASASYTGYLATTVAFSVTPAGQSVPIPLHPEANPSATTAVSGPSGLWILGGALVLVAVAMLLMALLLVRRRRPPAARTSSRRTGATVATGPGTIRAHP